MKGKINIGILGEFQNGKSTLVNCLLGRNVALTGGLGHNVTSVNTKYVYGDVSTAKFFQANGEAIKEFLIDSSYQYICPKGTTSKILSLRSNVLKQFNLIDTPGFNANDCDEQVAKDSLKDIDVAILLVTNKSLSSLEKDIARLLSSKSIPFFIIMNCMDSGLGLWNPDSEQNIIIEANILADLDSYNLSPISFGGHRLWRCNLLWYWHSTFCKRLNEIEKLQYERINSYYLFRGKPSENTLKTMSLFERIAEAFNNSSYISSLRLLSVLHSNFEQLLQNYIKRSDEFLSQRIVLFSKSLII